MMGSMIFKKDYLFFENTKKNVLHNIVSFFGIKEIEKLIDEFNIDDKIVA